MSQNVISDSSSLQNTARRPQRQSQSRFLKSRPSVPQGTVSRSDADSIATAMESHVPLSGFVCSPGVLSSAGAPFTTALTTSRTRFPSGATRRGSPARILALGPTPPPPPSEPEDEGEVGEDAGEGNPSEPVEEVTADDILSSPAFLKKKLELVQKELIDAKAALEEDTEAVKEEKDRYVRLAADFENYRRRSMEDLRKQDAKSTAKVCKEILGVLDNFDLATKAVNPQTEREEAISESYQVINKQLLDALAKLNVLAIDAVGTVFDPEMHEAIQKFESTEHPEDVVCAQYQRGYMMEQTLIRAAIVGVSTGPGPEGSETPNGNGANEVAAEGAEEDVAESEVETAGGNKTVDGS